VCSIAASIAACATSVCIMNRRSWPPGPGGGGGGGVMTPRPLRPVEYTAKLPPALRANHFSAAAAMTSSSLSGGTLNTARTPP
jgi:hypothetical protein